MVENRPIIDEYSRNLPLETNFIFIYLIKYLVEQLERSSSFKLNLNKLEQLGQFLRSTNCDLAPISIFNMYPQTKYNSSHSILIFIFNLYPSNPKYFHSFRLISVFRAYHSKPKQRIWRVLKRSSRTENFRFFFVCERFSETVCFKKLSNWIKRMSRRFFFSYPPPLVNLRADPNGPFH